MANRWGCAAAVALWCAIDAVSHGRFLGDYVNRGGPYASGHLDYIAAYVLVDQLK